MCENGDDEVNGISTNADLEWDHEDFINNLNEYPYQWVSSHKGLSANEEADRPEKIGIVERVQINLKPYYTEHLPKIKLDCYYLWKEVFNKFSIPKGIKLFRINLFAIHGSLVRKKIVEKISWNILTDFQDAMQIGRICGKP
ncbi:hypothetical protein EVAR_9579_1 [Eumeta japonica]|uniref:RNase H type-1 domain-containing protein n=1 Tax=Eumeta variegata TaxID=151549 RepID=A0A4C1TMJ1_EUMVA|nr:hypothetical protein EVAR_9579_1 [Eumeta japonica]